jgi:hypothetical protein
MGFQEMGFTAFNPSYKNSGIEGRLNIRAGLG